MKMFFENKHRRLIVAWLVLTIMMVLVLGAAVQKHFRENEQHALMNLGYVTLKESKTVPQFKLVDHHGKAVDQSLFDGQWSLVFFGFTSCPDVCPTTLGVLNRLYNKMAKKRHRTYLVSVDPDRDSPEKLSHYVTAFNPDFTALTGDESQVRELATGLKLVLSAMATQRTIWLITLATWP